MEILGTNMTLDFFLPFVWFILLLLVGWIVGHIVGWVVTWLLRRKPLKLDKRMKDWKVDDAIGYMSISGILGKLAKWFVYVLFISQASSLLDLGVISDVLELIVLFIPKLIVAILIVLATLIIADFVTDKIRSTKNKIYDLVGIILKPVLIIFGVIIAAEQINIDLSFLTDVIRDIIQAAVWGIAIAVALAVGLGYGLDKRDGKSTLPERVERIWKNVR